MIPSDKLILRVREFLQREEGEHAAVLASWGLARPDLNAVTRADLLAFKAQALMLMGEIQEAGRLLDEAQSTAVTPEVVLIGLELLLLVQDYTKAQGLLEGSWNLICDDGRAYVTKARILAACNEIEEALELLYTLSQQPTIPRGTFRALAQILMLHVGGEATLDAAKGAALGGYPTAADMMLYGQALLDVKRSQEAFDAFEGAFYLQPGTIGSLLGAFEALIQLRHYDHAMQLVNLMLLSPAMPGLVRIELTKCLILLGRNADAARLNYNILQQNPQEPNALLSLAMLANYEERLDDAKLFLTRLEQVEPNEFLSRIRAEYFLRRGELQTAWKSIMTFLRPIGPPVPAEIPSLIPGSPLEGQRLLIRACQPLRYLGFIPALKEQGATVHILVHPQEKEIIARVTQEPILISEECNHENFDVVIEDIKLPLLTTDITWPHSRPSQNEKKRLCLALYQPYGLGPGFDLPETVVTDIETRMMTLGYEIIKLEEGPLVDHLETIDTLDGTVIALDGPLMDLSACLGITTVLLASLIIDPLWLSPLGDQKYYPTLRVIRQPQYNSWEGVAEHVENIFKEKKSNANGES